MGHMTPTTPLLMVFCHPYDGTWVDILCMHTKFGHSNSFRGSRDIWLVTTEFYMVHVTWPHPFIDDCHPRAGTCYDQPAYQIWNLCLYPLQGYERRYKMSKLGWFGAVRVTQSHWKLHHSIERIWVHISLRWYLCPCLCCIVSEI